MSGRFEVDNAGTAARKGWTVLVQGAAHHTDSDDERAEVAQPGLERGCAVSEPARYNVTCGSVPRGRLEIVPPRGPWSSHRHRGAWPNGQAKSGLYARVPETIGRCTGEGSAPSVEAATLRDASVLAALQQAT